MTSSYLRSFVDAAGASTADLKVRFDAERDTPELIDAIGSAGPVIREIVADLRTTGVPLLPSSHVGTFGNFLRLPNHYRSVCFVAPSGDGGQDVNGVIAFKGTEPLLRDFPEYLDWVLRAPFRGSALPMGLHFPLDMKLPPGAMWIEECVLEQQISSTIQSRHLAQHGRLAQLPVPLFVFELTAEHVERYREAVRARLSPAAFSRIEAKIDDGLGVEVYYYAGVPVRAADLLVPDLSKAFAVMLKRETLETTCDDWIRLMADLLALGYMPYAPWNHGMGACVDPGNACIDGGFNDLLTIVPFDSIPNEYLFWRGLGQSIQLLAGSIAIMCSAATNGAHPSQGELPPLAIAYVTERLRKHIHCRQCNERSDPRLLRFLEAPSFDDVFRHMREIGGERTAAQYRPPKFSGSTAAGVQPTSEWRPVSPTLGV